MDLFKAVVSGCLIDLSENVKREDDYKRRGVDLWDEGKLNESVVII